MNFKLLIQSHRKLRTHNVFIIILLKKALIPLYSIWTIILNKPCPNAGEKICSADSDFSLNWQIPKCCTAFVWQPTELCELRASDHLITHLETSGLQIHYLDGVFCVLSRKNVQMFTGGFHMFCYNSASYQTRVHCYSSCFKILSDSRHFIIRQISCMFFTALD